MTITILPEKVGEEGITYRAIAGARYSAGRTAGEALDALTKQMSEEETSTLVIVQNLRPDRLFSAQQQERLSQLMTRWRTARDGGQTLSVDEQKELEGLIEAELKAATERAENAIAELGR